MTDLHAPPEWSGTSTDPIDETFGDAVAGIDLDDADGVDAVLVGEPYDGGVRSRRGAAEGPAGIRDSLAATKAHHFDAGPPPAVGDLGDVAVPEIGVPDAQATVRAVADAVHAVDAVPVFLGGDNSLTYANVAPLLDETGGSSSEAEEGTADPDAPSVGVVNCDSHLDVRATTDGPSSGSPYRQLLDDGLDAYACLGARHFETSTAYHDAVRELGADGAVVTAEEVGDDPVAAVDRALRALSGVDRVYLSVDIDVLDAAYPGASAPTPGGLTPRELFRVVRLVAADDRVAGFEVVECAPPLDADGRTVDAAARAVAHFLAGWSA